jgi:hypothetical protein
MRLPNQSAGVVRSAASREVLREGNIVPARVSRRVIGRSDEEPGRASCVCPCCIMEANRDEAGATVSCC